LLSCRLALSVLARWRRKTRRGSTTGRRQPRPDARR
jgi:hypothetical protein